MKEKILSLLMESGLLTGTDAETLAEFLADKGVIVPPCKFGDSIYWIDDSPVQDGGMPVVREEKNMIEAMIFTDDGKVYISSEPFYGNPAGFSVVNSDDFSYISKELAEEALERMIRTKKSKTIKWMLETGFAGDVHSGEFEVPGDATDDEIEEMAKDEAFNVINWSWWKKEDEDND